MSTYLPLIPNDLILTCQPTLINRYGLRSALFLSQIHYWLSNEGCEGKIHDGYKWVYNVEKEWARQLCCTPRTIRNHVRKLREENILFVEKLHDNRSNQMNYYRINYDLIEEICSGKRIKAHEEKRSSYKTKSEMTSTKGHQSIDPPEPAETFMRKNVPLPYKETEITFKNIYIYRDQKSFEEGDSDIEVLPPPEVLDMDTIPSEMLEIWNEVLGDKAPHEMSKHLEVRLKWAFKERFGEDLEEWEQFCKAILSSKFMMDENFTLSLFSILSPHSTMIEKINRGQLGIKMGKKTSADLRIFSNDEVLRMIDQVPEAPEIKRVRQYILGLVGHDVYHSWFHQAKITINNGKTILTAPNDFVKGKWEERYGDVMKKFR